MPTAENAKLQYEAGQTAFPMGALTDSGDATTFTSSASLFSGKTGSEPDVRPDGLLTGGVVAVPISGSNDVVDVAALTCYLLGVNTSVSVGIDTAVARAATDVASVSSITINAAGAITVIKGTDSADTTIVETRAAVGGPPEIPVGSIEIAQVRSISNIAAPYAAAEIFQVVGSHMERSDFPVFSIDSENAQVVFSSAIPTIHTSAVPKGVSASYSDPIFADISLASDFVPAETSHSVSSTQIYSNTLGSSSKTLNQGSFTAFLNDGVSDALVTLKDETLWFKFFPDKFKVPNIIQQGKLGISRTFAADDNIQASCTISAAVASTEVIT